MFDRSAITEGRRIQDFGLCDLNGVYQLTAKMRAKGWMVITFFTPGDACSREALNILAEWSSSLPADKVSIAAVLVGDESALDAYKSSQTGSLPVLWDIEAYWADNWGLSALPTTFVTDTGGRVRDRIVGAETNLFTEAKAQLMSLIEKAAAAAKAAADAAAAAQAAAPAPTAAPPAAVQAPPASPVPVAAAPTSEAPQQAAKAKESSKPKSGKK